MSHKSCNTCKLSITCPAKAEIENELIAKFHFLDRLAIIAGKTNFWQSLAEVCSRYESNDERV